jgi:hypothetical protein
MLIQEDMLGQKLIIQMAYCYMYVILHWQCKCVQTGQDKLLCKLLLKVNTYLATVSLSIFRMQNGSLDPDLQ